MKTVVDEIIEASEFFSIIDFKRWVTEEKGRLKEKGKQQIIEACIKTTQDCWVSNALQFGLDLVFTDEDLENQRQEAEQYYNETFS